MQRVNHIARGIGLSLLLAFILSACTSNPVREAQTLEQRSYAVYGSFVIFKEQAAELKQSGVLDNRSQDFLRALDAKVSPVADSGLSLMTEVSRIRFEIEHAATAEEAQAAEKRLAYSILSLDRWLTEATPEIEAFISAVQGAK